VAAPLTGLGFEPFTPPSARGQYRAGRVRSIFRSPLAVTTCLPLDRLSAGVGRICAPVSLFVPAYLIAVMSGWKGLKGVLPAAAACGIAFAGTQFLVSNFMGPQLTDILASMAAMGALLVVIRQRGGSRQKHSGHTIMMALHLSILSLFVLLWGYKPLQTWLAGFNVPIQWPGLHNVIRRMPPAVARPVPYAAVYTFPWLAASGTACLFAAILSAMVAGLSLEQFGRVLRHTMKQLALAELTLATVLAIAMLMNYSGATATLGLGFAATGVLFPFFSALLGWLGVFLTGSDTSANALFGTLQVVTAEKLGQNPVLMAAANSAGGVMGKMISLTSIAVAAAATSMKREDEALLFRFTLRHSVFLASMIGLLVMFYAYVMPAWPRKAIPSGNPARPMLATWRRRKSRWSSPSRPRC
jgi:lactate permease